MAPPRVTAVVCAYWPERFKNVGQIVNDLCAGTRAPDHIIILNNNPDHPRQFEHLKRPGIDVVTGFNTETRGKYVAALFVQADYYLLMDDDITIGKLALEYLMKRAHPDLVTANRGVLMRPDNSFFNGALADADKVPYDYPADSVCGCGVFVSHRALVKMFAAEEGLRSEWPTAGDDILLGLANKGNVVIFPMIKEKAWIWLDDGGVALCDGNGVLGKQDYYHMRDQFTREALEHLK